LYSSSNDLWLILQLGDRTDLRLDIRVWLTKNMNARMLVNRQTNCLIARGE